MDKYIVHWKYKNKPIKGHGKPINKEDAAEAVRQANLLYPHIKYWIVKEDEESISC